MVLCAALAKGKNATLRKTNKRVISEHSLFHFPLCNIINNSHHLTEDKGLDQQGRFLCNSPQRNIKCSELGILLVCYIPLSVQSEQY